MPTGGLRKIVLLNEVRRFMVRSSTVDIEIVQALYTLGCMKRSFDSSSFNELWYIPDLYFPSPPTGTSKSASPAWPYPNDASAAGKHRVARDAFRRSCSTSSHRPQTTKRASDFVARPARLGPFYQDYNDRPHLIGLQPRPDWAHSTKTTMTSSNCPPT